MDAAETLLVAVRAVHFGASMVLFGEVLFASLFVPRTTTDAPGPGAHSRSFSPRSRRVLVAAWACMAISGALWLVLVSMQMSGRPLDGPTIATVLGSTVFGRTWLVRAVLAAALAALWPLLASAAQLRRGAPLAMIASGALLASLAWSGHANAQVGPNGAIHHLSDAIHLLAAGAWLGGLAPLAALLRQADSPPDDRAFASCAKAVTRFGNAAALSVGAIVMTGLVNAFYLLPGPGALFETSYGRLLLLKLCAFLVLLAIAAVNRNRLTPALNPGKAAFSGPAAAARALRRNVLLEQVVGALVILLAAALGVSAPAMRM